VNSFIWKQIWESRYYSDELFNVIFTLKSEIYYSNSSIKKIIGSKHYILAAKSEDLENQIPMLEVTKDWNAK
jgi:hypothetical protein